MTWRTVGFGKFKGKSKTLPQIVWDEPDWFFWAVDNGVFTSSLLAEAEFVAERARAIRVPQTGDELVTVEYGVSPRDGKFCGLELVPVGRARHEGGTRTLRVPVIDLNYPRELCGYDKFGSRLIVRQAKHILFGDESYRMTRARAEAFFEDDANFVLDRVPSAMIPTGTAGGR